MIEKIIEYSIRNRFLVLFITAALTVAGIYAVFHTPVDAIPDLSENQVIVFTDWMGRSPKEIEDQVTYPLSRKLQGLAGALACWAVYAVLQTPVDAAPDLSENQVIVFTDWMGRSPKEVQDQITYPLSLKLQGLAGVKAIRSSSEFNFSIMVNPDWLADSLCVRGYFLGLAFSSAILARV